ncbi:hypothetical protein [Mucilaginibacter sp. 44-25]|uniref:hypothetical protein n=1 Tax=Mucilaginibacter sp. 44-25 TaxID=1895794 RepID=UPI0025EFC9E5|nr:hypothetical protein [Mucilaginibacter sp. 44-25]
MKNFKITKWDPIDGLPPMLYLEGLYDDYEGFRLLLKGKNTADRLVKIKFESHIGYRNTDESNRLKMLCENPILTSQWTLFTSNNSDFLEWIIAQSSDTLDTSKIYINYIICTPNDIVEVLSAEEPSIEWL